MSTLSTLTPIAAVLAVSLSGLAQATSDNPFAAKPLSGGFAVAAHHEAGKEGKCGEAKCGSKKDDKVAKEGKCGGMKEDKAAKEGKCGGMSDDKAAKEGKCGGMKDDKAAKEGKCGSKT